MGPARIHRLTILRKRARFIAIAAIVAVVGGVGVA
jgi:hypothetical protein